MRRDNASPSVREKWFEASSAASLISATKLLNVHPQTTLLQGNRQSGLRKRAHILFYYETVSNKLFEVVNLQGSVNDQFED